MGNKNDKMTLEKLAEMTQKGFGELRGEINEKFDKVDERFKKVDEKFEKVDERFEKVDERFSQVLDNQDHILKRLDNLESDNTMDMSVHRRQGDKLENHEKRIVVVEEKVLV